MPIKSLLCLSPGLPFLTGIIATILFGKRKIVNRNSGLLFHSVLPGTILPNLSCLSVNNFQKILNFIKDHKYSSTLLCNAKFTSKTDSLSEFLLTFDDGFQSIFDYALPVLEETGFKASIFCVTDYIGKSSTWDVYGKSKHLDKQSIYKLSQLGHEIGSHTCTHANLPYLSTKDLTHELYDSKCKLEDIIGKRVTSLSFPHGSWNNRVWEKACDIGYLSASTYRNHAFKGNYRLFPVYGVHQFDSPDSVKAKLSSNSIFSISIAIASTLPHFAKGTPIWKFRKNYFLFPK